MSEEKPKLLRSLSVKDGKKIIGHKAMAYKEYLAARSLLNLNMLHQAAFFINTFLEKELKALLYASHIDPSTTHETFKLLNLAKEKLQYEWLKEINPEFVKLISKIYKSRYFEGLGAGYNFVINRNKFLAEIDFIFSLIESKIKIETNASRDRKNSTQFLLEKEEKSPRLFQNNYLLNEISKETFLNQPDLVYEFRVAQTFHIVEIEYQIPRNIELGKFDYVGLDQKAINQFTLSQSENK